MTLHQLIYLYSLSFLPSILKFAFKYIDACTYCWSPCIIRILFLRNQLLSEIKEVRRTRAVQRAARKRHGDSNGQELPTVAIVGYTNAVCLL